MIVVAKKAILLLILITIMILCGISGLVLAVDKLVAPKVSKPPTIDGTIGENEWRPALKTEVTPTTGSWDFGKTEVRYTFYVMYDEKYLYVAARLTDNEIQTDSAAEGSINGQTWKDDSIEIFVDGNHNHAPNAFVDAEYKFGGQYVITAKNAIRFENSGAKSFGDGVDDDDYASADIKDQKQWEMEARLRLSLFGSPKQGDIVGFNISTNDDDGGGDEEAALFWTGKPPNIYKNEQVWGDLIFGSPVYFFNVNATLRAFMERCTSLLKRRWHPEFPYPEPDWSKTISGAISIGSDRHGGQEQTITTIIHWLLTCGFPVVGSNYIGAPAWQMGSVRNDELGLEGARNLARRICKLALLVKEDER